MPSPTRSPQAREPTVPAAADAWLEDHGAAVLGVLRRLAPAERGEELLAKTFERVHRQMLDRQSQGKKPLDHEMLRTRLLLAAREVVNAEAAGRDSSKASTVQDSDTFPMPGDTAESDGLDSYPGGDVEPIDDPVDPGAATVPPDLSATVATSTTDAAGGPSRPQRVRAAFNSLDPGDRRLVQDLVLDGHSLEAAARRADLPEDQARTQLLAALRRFRAALGGE